jgi:hypothetical protein
MQQSVPAATDAHATIEILLETVFSSQSVQRGYKQDNWKKNSSAGRELPFRDDLSPEAEEQPLLEAVTEQLLVKTMRDGKDFA